MGDLRWIKITTDIFDNEKMLVIESRPDANEMIIIWFKLLCLAGKKSGTGVFTIGGKPYTDELFSIVFRRPVEEVREALDLFESLEMITREDGVVAIKNWKKHQSVDELEYVRAQTRARVAKHREKQKMQAAEGLKTTPENADVTLCNGECNAIEKNRVDKSRIEENRVDKSRAAESRIEENRVDKSRAAESRIEEMRADEIRLPDACQSSAPPSAAAEDKYLDFASGDYPEDDSIQPLAIAPKKAAMSDSAFPPPSAAAEEDFSSVNRYGELKPVSGKGREVVMLSDEQISSLRERLGEDVYQGYLDRLSSFIIEKRAKIKNHYETIMKWYVEDKNDGTAAARRRGNEALEKEKSSHRAGNFDYDEAFRYALARSNVLAE